MWIKCTVYDPFFPCLRFPQKGSLSPSHCCIEAAAVNNKSIWIPVS